MKLIYNDHEIEITAFETRKIFYDRTLISSKKSIFGSTHIFTVIENGENVQYEIRVGLKWHELQEKINIRRNGRIIYSDHYHEEGIRIERITSLTKTQKIASGFLRVAIVALLAFVVVTNYMNYMNKESAKEEEVAFLEGFERSYIKN